MRPVAFQCCMQSQESQDSELQTVSGFRMKFETVQNFIQAEGEDQVPYFVAAPPKQVETGCIGKSCSSGCHDYVHVQAFPETSDPIKAFSFFSDNISRLLIGISIQVGANSLTEVCPGSLQKYDAENISAVDVDVEAPIVGFEYSHDQTGIRSLRLITNSCSLNGFSAFELALSDVPEPIMLELNDLNYHGKDFELEIKLPLRPEVFARREYAIDLGQIGCSYNLLGTVVTPEVPDYIKLLRLQDGLYSVVLSRPTQSGWPSEPRHDMLSIQCTIGDTLFITKRTLEVVFYEFDYEAGQSLAKPCFHYVAEGSIRNGKSANISQEEMLKDYRFARSSSQLQCCLNPAGLVTRLRLSKDENIEAEENCHIKSVKLKEVESYLVAKDKANYVVDLLLKLRTEGSQVVSVCGKSQIDQDWYFEQIDVSDHGHLVSQTLENPDNSQPLASMEIIANRCLISPEYAKFSQPLIHYFLPGSQSKRVLIQDPSYDPNGVRYADLPELEASDGAIVLTGWQPQKSLISDPILHAKNIAWLDYSASRASEILAQDSDSSFDIRAYQADLVLPDQDYSYQVYKPVLYQSELVKFKLTRLLAVIYMKEMTLPEDYSTDTDTGDDKKNEEKEDKKNDENGENDENEEKGEQGESGKSGQESSSSDDDSSDEVEGGSQDSHQNQQLSCTLDVIHYSRSVTFYLEDDKVEDQLHVQLNPVRCQGDQSHGDFHVEHTLSAEVDDTTLSAAQTDRLLFRASSDLLGAPTYIFDTSNRSLIGKVVKLTQESKVMVLDSDSGIEKLFETFTRLLVSIKVKSRCNNLTILPQHLHVMHIQHGAREPVYQKFKPLSDIDGLISQGKCGMVNASIQQRLNRDDENFALLELPESVVIIDDFDIKLVSDGTQRYRGRFEFDLVFLLVDFDQRFAIPFDIFIGSYQARTKEEIRSVINIAPAFASFKSGQQAQLPEQVIMAGRPNLYTLPRIEEWNEDDQVSVKIQIGNDKLVQCGCIRLQQTDFPFPEYCQSDQEIKDQFNNQDQCSQKLSENASRVSDQHRQYAIYFNIPESLSGESTTVIITISDGLSQSLYFLSIQTVAFVADSLDLQLPQETETKHSLPLQNMLRQIISAESVDVDSENAKRKEELQEKVMQKCIPIFTRVKSNGEVRVKFARNLVLDSEVDELMDQIVSSGSIQLQLLDESLPMDDIDQSLSEKSFTWTLSLSAPNELLIKIKFDDPSAVSGQGNSLDRLRIIFVETSEFLRCEQYSQVEDKRRLSSSDNEPPKDNIPSNYSIIIELPAQITDDQNSQQEQTIESMEPPTLTFYYSSIVLTTFNHLSLQTLWGGVSALQIIAHIPLNNVNMPANCFFIFHFLAEIVSFDLFAPTDHADFGFTETEPLNQRFDRLGYETSNFVENLGSIGLIAFLMALRMLVVPCVVAIVKRINCCKCCNKFQNRLSQSGPEITNFWLRFGVQTFFELLVCSLIGFRLARVIYSEKTWQDNWALRSAYIFGVLVFLLVLFVGYMTLFHVRPYVNYTKDREECRGAKWQQAVYQDPRFQTLLDYGPNICLRTRDDTSQPVVAQYSANGTQRIVGGTPGPKLPLPPRRQVLLRAPSDLAKITVRDFAKLKYFQELFRGLKPWKISAMPFFFMHLVRRISFVLVAIYLAELPFMQVLIYLISSMAMVSYLASYRVFVDNDTCQIEIFNEAIVLLVGYLMVALMCETAKEIGSSSGGAKNREIVGKAMLSCIIVICVINSIKFCIEQCRSLKLRCRRCRARIQLQRKKELLLMQKENRRSQQKIKSSLELKNNGQKVKRKRKQVPVQSSIELPTQQSLETQSALETQEQASPTMRSRDGKLILNGLSRLNNQNQQQNVAINRQQSHQHRRLNSELIGLMDSEEDLQTQRLSTQQQTLTIEEEQIFPRPVAVDLIAIQEEEIGVAVSSELDIRYLEDQLQDISPDTGRNFLSGQHQAKDTIVDLDEIVIDVTQSSDVIEVGRETSVQIPDETQSNSEFSFRIKKKQSELSIPQALSSDLDDDTSQARYRDLKEEHKGNFAMEADAVLNKHYSKVQVQVERCDSSQTAIVQDELPKLCRGSSPLEQTNPSNQCLGQEIKSIRFDWRADRNLISIEQEQTVKSIGGLLKALDSSNGNQKLEQEADEVQEQHTEGSQFNPLNTMSQRAQQINKHTRHQSLQTKDSSLARSGQPLRTQMGTNSQPSRESALAFSNQFGVSIRVGSDRDEDSIKTEEGSFADDLDTMKAKQQAIGAVTHKSAEVQNEKSLTPLQKLERKSQQEGQLSNPIRRQKHHRCLTERNKINQVPSIQSLQFGSVTPLRELSQANEPNNIKADPREIKNHEKSFVSYLESVTSEKQTKARNADKENQ